MSDYLTETEAGVPSVAMEGQMIMPFYILCDVSGSMHGDMPALNAALAQLRSDIMSDPVVDDLTMLSVITFSTGARTVVPLAAPSEITLPTLTSSGTTEYGAGFREYHRAFEADRARLKAAGKKVYRPCVFLLTDGGPTDRDYLSTFRSLFTYDPATKQGNKAFPYVVTFGFRDAPEKVMRELAYPDFGSSRGKWFVARTNNVGELLKSMTSAIGKTVISSGLSVTVGPPQIVPPTMTKTQGVQFGEAGDFV